MRLFERSHKSNLFDNLSFFVHIRYIYVLVHIYIGCNKYYVCMYSVRCSTIKQLCDVEYVYQKCIDDRHVECLQTAFP